MKRACCFRSTKACEKERHAKRIRPNEKKFLRMNKRLLLLSTLIICLFSAGYSQKWKLTRYEVHFGIGTTNVFGDIGGTMDKNNLWGIKDIRINETGLSLYGGARYKIAIDQSIKFNLIYGMAKGSDANSKNGEGRGFSYSTTIFEPSVQYEYYFISEDRRNRPSNLYNRTGMLNNYTKMGLYVFGGVGGVLFNPKLSYSIRQPSTEYPYYETTSGYGKFAIVLPIGIGFKYGIDRFWSLGFEFGRRIALTDYLDGFSSKFSKSNDTYYFGMFHAIYKLETDRKGRPVFLKKLGWIK
jgi:hypothetical protein